MKKLFFPPSGKYIFMSENLFIDCVDTGNNKAFFLLKKKNLWYVYISWLVHELSPIHF